MMLLKVAILSECLIKEINKFLTGGFSNITQAIEISKDEASGHYRDLVEYMRQPLYW